MAYSTNLQIGVNVVIQIAVLLCTAKTETPDVFLISDSGNYSKYDLFKNHTKIYNLSEVQKNVFTISCTFHSPSRWYWKGDENLKLSNVTKEMEVLSSASKDSKFISNLTIHLDSSTGQLETNFSCLTGSRNDPPVNVTCVEVLSLGLEPIQLQIFSDMPMEKCFLFTESITAELTKNCTKDLTIDLHNSLGVCEEQNTTKTKTVIKTEDYIDLDTCKSYNEQHRCVNATFRPIINGTSLNSSRVYNLENVTKFPLQVYCMQTYDNIKTSIRLLYPSVTETRDWERFSYYKTVEDARHSYSVELIALENGQESLTKINDRLRRNEFALGETVTFVCVAVKYLFMSGIQWTINNTGFHKSDETDERVSSMIRNSSLSHYLYLVPKNIYIDGTKYGNSLTVTCHVPDWDSGKYVSSTINATLSPPVPPATNLTCKEDDKTVNCSCQYSGWPKPNITWDYKKQNLRNADSNIDASNESANLQKGNCSNEIAFLKVGTVSEALDITCTAAVFQRNVSAKYKLKVLNTPATSWILYIVILVCLLAVMTVGIILIYWRYRKNLILYNERQNNLTMEEIDEFYTGASLNSTTYDALLLPYNSEYEIPREELSMNDTILGAGQFGLVLKGMIGPLQVAVKTIKPTADVIYFKSLLTELKILQYVGPHRNIVNLVGANTANIKRREVYLILDYCSNGSLADFLKKNRSRFVNFFNESISKEEKCPQYENADETVLTTGNLIGFATEIAGALDHLTAKNVIHGDLAARNVLVTEDLHAKICDFGLSKQLLHYSVYVQKIGCPLPLRWMALESLQDMEFSLASDKWSYGVVLWETFSLGELPYPGEQWSFASYQRLQEGYRMAKPKFANNEIYRLMLECWNSEPSKRPCYQYIINQLKKEEEMLI